MDPYSIFILLSYSILFLIFFITFTTSFIGSIGISLIHPCGLYNIGKKFELNHKFFAFLPIFKSHYFGKIAEICAEKSGGKKRRYSLILTALSILSSVAYIGILTFDIIFALSHAQVQNGATTGDYTHIFSIIIATSSLIFLAIIIVKFVYFHIANYQVMKYSDPNKATIYTVISILLGNIGIGIITLILSYRQKENV